MRTALYIRVSTQEQADEGFSISAQHDRLHAFCQSQGWNVCEVYTEEGQSAKDMDRPELQRLLKDAQSGLFDVVLVYRLDRLTRSVMDLYTILETFKRHNVKFKSATELYDTTTAMGQLFITLVAALAEWERNNLSERVRFGMEQMVREGKRPGSKLPYGYDKDGNVIEEERMILRELRRLYMDGDGFKGVAVKLNQRGMLRRGRHWGAQRVFEVLDNPFYAGKIRWGGKKPNGKYATRKKEELVNCIIVDSDHEPIFTWDEYTEQTNRMKRRSFNGYTKIREYWFAGVLRCAKCGSAMTGRYHENKRQDGSKNRILSYICANRQMGEGCTMPMFRQELVEHLVMDWIANVKLDRERIESMKQKSKREQKRNESELTILRKELNKIRERKKKWQYMMVEDLITEQDYRQRKAEEDQNEFAVMEQIETIEQAAAVDESPSISLMLQLPELWKVIDDKEKNELVTSIFSYIELDTPLERAHGKKGQFIPSFISRAEYN